MWYDQHKYLEGRRAGRTRYIEQHSRYHEGTGYRGFIDIDVAGLEVKDSKRACATKRSHLNDRERREGESKRDEEERNRRVRGEEEQGCEGEGLVCAHFKFLLN